MHDFQKTRKLAIANRAKTARQLSTQSSDRKSRFCLRVLATDRHRQTNRWTAPSHKATVAIASRSLINPSNRNVY